MPAPKVQRGHRPVRLVRPVPDALTVVFERLRADAHRILRGAVDAVDPARLLAAHHGRALSSLHTPLDAVAAGKAAWPMAHAFARLVSDDLGRMIVAGPRTGGLDVPDNAEWFDAAHPFPNNASVAAAARAMTTARECAAAGRTLVILLSGGASSMLAAPAPGISLADKIATARALMRAGVAIDGLNCVRRHLSAIKGGRLGAAAGDSVTLAISDVHGPVPDDPAVIGSGPTFADPTTFAEAVEVMRSVAGVPDAVRQYLTRGAAGEVPETIKPGDARLAAARYEIIGNRVTALDGAVRAAEALGYDVIAEPAATSGEARDTSQAFVARARRAAESRSRPLCVLAAGETTVTVVGEGKGGRNQEFALAAAPLMASLGRASLLASAGTDGADGPTDAAGALVDSTTSDRAQRLGLDGRAALAANDAYHFFEPLGDLIVWGPTGTNVGDVHVLLIA